MVLLVPVVLLVPAVVLLFPAVVPMVPMVLLDPVVLLVPVVPVQQFEIQQIITQGLLISVFQNSDQIDQRGDNGCEMCDSP